MMACARRFPIVTMWNATRPDGQMPFGWIKHFFLATTSDSAGMGFLIDFRRILFRYSFSCTQRQRSPAACNSERPQTFL